MIKLGILLSAALVVAGCSGAPVGNDTLASNAAGNEGGNDSYVSPNLAGGTWNGVFGDPKTSIDNFSRIGLRPGPYQKKGAEWRSEAVPTAMSDPSGPHPVMAFFTAIGDEQTLNKIEFALVEPQMSNNQQARDQFDRWLKQALTQLGVSGGDTVIGSIHGEKRLTGKLKTGADYTVARTTTPKERRLVVTFTRAEPILNGTDAATS